MISKLTHTVCGVFSFLQAVGFSFVMTVGRLSPSFPCYEHLWIGLNTQSWKEYNEARRGWNGDREDERLVPQRQAKRAFRI